MGAGRQHVANRLDLAGRAAVGEGRVGVCAGAGLVPLCQTQLSADGEELPGRKLLDRLGVGEEGRRGALGFVPVAPPVPVIDEDPLEPKAQGLRAKALGGLHGLHPAAVPLLQLAARLLRRREVVEGADLDAKRAARHRQLDAALEVGDPAAIAIPDSHGPDQVERFAEALIPPERFGCRLGPGGQRARALLVTHQERVKGQASEDPGARPARRALAEQLLRPGAAAIGERAVTLHPRRLRQEHLELGGALIVGASEQRISSFGQALGTPSSGVMAHRDGAPIESSARCGSSDGQSSSAAS